MTRNQAGIRGSRVVVAMSGGVDSSVTAALLLEQGCDVIGVTMKVWDTPFDTGPSSLAGPARGCCSVAAAEDARRVAAKLGIPHYVMDVRGFFEATVIANFREEYAAGRTPNPCIDCNRQLKFCWLPQKAGELGARFIATGHYARIVHDAESGQFFLHRARDAAKDQSYVLYMLTQQQAAEILMPLGEWTKKQVREFARRNGFGVADKPDSQEICFVEDNDYGRFLQEMSPNLVRRGAIRLTSGEIVGEHRGVAFHTIGQRRGLGVAAPRPLYVVKMDAATNTLWVGEEPELYATALTATQVKWTAGEPPGIPQEVRAQIRYRSSPHAATLTHADLESLSLRFHQPQRAITPGQSVVIYEDDRVLGGGIIRGE